MTVKKDLKADLIARLRKEANYQRGYTSGVAMTEAADVLEESNESLSHYLQGRQEALEDLLNSMTDAGIEMASRQQILDLLEIETTG